MPKQTLADQYVEVLLHLGYREEKRLTNYRVFTPPDDNSPTRDRMFVGKAGALRMGRTKNESLAMTETFKESFLKIPQAVPDQRKKIAETEVLTDPPQGVPDGPPCPACKGSGRFYAKRTGRDVGPCFKCGGEGVQKKPEQKKEVNGVDVSAQPILDAFNKAHDAGVQTPALKLDTFRFSRAPDTGKNPGAIYVTENKVYLGMIKDGQFKHSPACTGEQKQRIVFCASQPKDAAEAYGMTTGQCCACGQTLTREESKKRLMGDICAAKYGWA